MIIRCPICGGKLQAVSEVYHSGITLDEDGDIDDDGEIVGTETGVVICCENDHTYGQIMSEISP